LLLISPGLPAPFLDPPLGIFAVSLNCLNSGANLLRKTHRSKGRDPGIRISRVGFSRNACPGDRMASRVQLRVPGVYLPFALSSDFDVFTAFTISNLQSDTVLNSSTPAASN